jgi:hypothetical protein
MTVEEQRKLHADCAYWAEKRAESFILRAQYYRSVAEYHRFKVEDPLLELEMPEKPENLLTKY